jgi:putative nucleotidyltransferase with HDIG domain
MNFHRQTDKSGFTAARDNARSRRKVLLVDDDYSAVRTFLGVFRGGDIEVKSATSADQGLNMVRDEQFSVAVSDFKTPGGDGIRFLEQVRYLRPEVVRILATGETDFDSVIDVINRVGLFSFIAKPFEADSLRAAVLSALDRYEMAGTNRSLTAELARRCSELSELNRTLEAQVQARSSFLLGGLINALDLRDTERHWHSRRVALYARRLAESLGLGGHDLLQVERGALLHDVGKVGVSDMILKKRGALTGKEREEMKRHSEYGYRILQGIDFLGRAREIVWQHHERWNGSGYPRGLKGMEIDMGARIFAVIDSYDAMTSDRPYREALSHRIARAEINLQSGILYDPDIVRAWNSVPLNEIESIRELVTEPFAGLD